MNSNLLPENSKKFGLLGKKTDFFPGLAVPTQLRNHIATSGSSLSPSNLNKRKKLKQPGFACRKNTPVETNIVSDVSERSQTLDMLHSLLSQQLHLPQNEVASLAETLAPLVLNKGGVNAGDDNNAAQKSSLNSSQKSVPQLDFSAVQTTVDALALAAAAKEVVVKKGVDVEQGINNDKSKEDNSPLSTSTPPLPPSSAQGNLHEEYD